MVKDTFEHGIEQEFQVVDPWTGELKGGVEEILRGLPKDWLGIDRAAGIEGDHYPTQLEHKTGICVSIDDIREGLIVNRTEMIKYARKCDYALIATGVNPFSTTDYPGESFGEHHHVGGNETSILAVRRHNLIREFIPELHAFTVNSPIYGKKKTDYMSYRAHRSPHIHPGSRVKFSSHRSVSNIEDAKRIYGSNPRYWDVTPYAFIKRGYPTVEVRLFDTQTSIDMSVAITAILEALALKAKKMNEQDRTPPKIDENILCYNRNQAIKHGMSAEFKVDKNVKYLKEGECFAYHSKEIDSKSSIITATQAVKELIVYIENELDEIGADSKILSPVNKAIEKKQTPASHQLDIFNLRGIESLSTELMNETIDGQSIKRGG